MYQKRNKLLYIESEKSVEFRFYIPIPDNLRVQRGLPGKAETRRYSEGGERKKRGEESCAEESGEKESCRGGRRVAEGSSYLQR